MADMIQPLLNIEQYVKRLNWYLQEHYPANKKITSEEWNALFLALIKQGNLQEETLERICNSYLPLQITKINALVDTANDHESRIRVLRTDTDATLKASKYAVETSNEALKRVIQNIGTASYVDGALMHELFYTSDPQVQLDSLFHAFNNFEKDFGEITTKITESIKAEAATRLANDNSLQSYIDAEKNARIAADANLQTQINNETTNRTQAVDTLQTQITIIDNKIPTQASSTNQLADKDFVNSSIATATATFKGTFTTLDELKLTVADENDYAYHDHTDLYGNRMFDRYKYSSGSWAYEYTLNNSSFTEEQWKAINSGITDTLVAQINTNMTTINNEIQNRANEDANLQTQINTLAESASKIILRRWL